MPLSPLTRWLIALTLIAFVMVFVTMNDPESWLAPGTLGVALSLWTASVYRIVAAGANLDERGFHLTRPKGGRKAFVRTSVLLFAMVLIVSLMAAVRAWWYHLGWLAMLAGFIIAFALLLMITTGLATGLQLSFARTRPIKWIGWLMIALPVAVYVYKLESKHRELWQGNRVMESWTSNLTPAVILTALGYGLAWWLSTSCRKWWPGLMLAAASGLCLPLENEAKPLYGRDLPLLPMASVEFQRQTVEDSGKELDSPEGKMGTFQPINSISFSGMKPDELLNGNYIVPIASVGFGLPRVDPTRSGKTLLQLRDGWQTREGKSFDWGMIDYFLASNLGKHLEPKPRDLGPFRDRFTYLKVPGNPILDRLNQEPWKFSGWLSRVEHKGDFPAFSSGTLDIDPAGRLDYQPVIKIHGQIRLNLRLFMPDSGSNPTSSSLPGFSPYFRSENVPRILLVSRSGARVAVTERLSEVSRHRALGSVWTEMVGVVSPSAVDSWPEDELSGARFHLFTERQVARVETEIPPPVK